MTLLKIPEQICNSFYLSDFLKNLIRDIVQLVHIEVLPMQTVTIYWTLSIHIAAAIFPLKDISSYNQNFPVISPLFQVF